MARQRRNLTVELTDEQADALLASAIEQYEVAEVLAERRPPRRRQAAVVPPHPSFSERCIHCGTPHTKRQHWSHAAAGTEPNVSSYLCPGCGTPVRNENRTQKVARKRPAPQRKTKKKAARKRSPKKAKPIRWTHEGTTFEAVPKRTEVTGYELYAQPPGARKKTYIGLLLTLPDARAAGEAYVDGMASKAKAKTKTKTKKTRAAPKKKTTTKRKTTRKKAAPKRTATKKTSTRQSTSRKKTTAKRSATRSTKKSTIGRTQKVATSRAKKKAAPRKKTTKRKTTSTRSSSKKTAKKATTKRTSKATTKAARPKPSGTQSAASSAAVSWKRAAPGAYSGSWFGPGAMRLFSAQKDNVTGQWVLRVGEGGAVPNRRSGDYATLSGAKQAAEDVVRGALGGARPSPSRTASKAKTKTKTSAKKAKARSTSKRAPAVVPVTWQQTAPGTYSGAMYGPDRMTLFSARESARGRWELLVDEGGFSADKKLGTFPSLAEAQEGAASYLQKGKAKVTQRRKRPRTGKPPAAPKKLTWAEVAPRRYAGSAQGYWFSVFRNGGRTWKLFVGEGRMPDTLVGEYRSAEAAMDQAEAFLPKRAA